MEIEPNMVRKTDKNFVTKVALRGFAPILPTAKLFLRFKTLVRLMVHWGAGGRNEKIFFFSYDDVNKCVYSL